ncbi:histone-lysine N-methyltransferase SETMAR-like [Stegodyphus dumicola]|uniref:histone-lysine N-methyltransferase SETMAR-like n=1 Tax=Stegodyphus dumicola TaxID=202533 RepID=UPI0015AFA259|nr:histone-lysine N-methyltransferase SETMAR-like [Stegodyphus dumicola]
MCTALGTNAVSYDTVNVWYLKFKNKSYGIQEAEGFVLLTDADEHRLPELVEEDLYATTRELTRELDDSAMSIRRDMFRINVTYKISRWVSHELTQTDKNRRVRVCTNLLEYQRKDKFLDRIVACDEKWIYFKKTGRKFHSALDILNLFSDSRPQSFWT